MFVSITIFGLPLSSSFFSFFSSSFPPFILHLLLSSPIYTYAPFQVSYLTSSILGHIFTLRLCTIRPFY
ncbi:hypothetical protein E2C01_075733 [Portunus trituberculatus]|uniref:Uncharacterized protein n=1 Tax=Portunus trituberculatus TaxID=210409 RepID=A0A5B7I6U6_PORTR|nr:hypothetical protein [Portunus trituberculatus]